MTVREDGALIVSLLIDNPAGLTWRELAERLGYTVPEDRSLANPAWYRFRRALEFARDTAKLIDRVIPRPLLGNDYRYRLDTMVGGDPTGVAPGTYGSWVHTREDHITRLRTLIQQAEVLAARNDMDPTELRHLRRQLTKDRGALVTLEDELASFRSVFANGSAA